MLNPIQIVNKYMKKAAEIRRGKKDNTDYLYIDNLMISDNPVAEKRFHLRYKKPGGKIYEMTLVPQDPEEKEDLKALHSLWYALKDKMKKARPNQDINIFKLLNAEPFRSRIRREEEPQQMRLNLK